MSLIIWKSHKKRVIVGRATALAGIAALCVLILSGCGEAGVDEEESRPEAVTAYQAVSYTKRAANKWQEDNWAIIVRDGDPEGLTRDGRARIWEIYYFSPRPELYGQMLVIYNRGNVWPNKPIRNRGGDEGREVYKKEKPMNFRVDSPEAINVAYENGGAEYLKQHPAARVNATLRCKADYMAVGDEMPSSDYKWIWTVTFREPGQVSGYLVVQVDGVNGELIKKETAG